MDRACDTCNMTVVVPARVHIMLLVDERQEQVERDSDNKENTSPPKNAAQLTSQTDLSTPEEREQDRRERAQSARRLKKIFAEARRAAERTDPGDLAEDGNNLYRHSLWIDGVRVDSFVGVAIPWQDGIVTTKQLKKQFAPLRREVEKLSRTNDAYIVSQPGVYEGDKFYQEGTRLVIGYIPMSGAQVARSKVNRGRSDAATRVFEA